MRQIKEFNGTLIVDAMQVQGENKIYFQWKISGFKSLSLNNLVGTITKQIFNTFKTDKVGHAKGGLKASQPVHIRLTTDKGEVIADTARIDKKFAAVLTLRSERNFAMALFTGLKTMRQKTVITSVTSFVEDKMSLSYVNANDMVLWAKTSVEPIQAATEPTV